MTASRSDMNVLSGDAGFQGRVRASLISTAIAITTEAASVLYHRERQKYAVQILNAPDTYKLLFANTVSTDTNCIADATANGTVILTSGNVLAQAALVTDAHIDAAISGEFNSFFLFPSS